MKHLFIFFLTGLFPLLNKAQNFSVNKDSLIGFSIKFDNADKDKDHPQYSIIETKLLNNSADTVMFIQVTDDDYLNLKLENKEIHFGQTDFGPSYHLAKTKIAPFDSIVKKIVVMYFHYVPKRSVEKFRIGFNFISINANQKLETESSKLNIGTNIIWSNFLIVN